MPFCPSIRPSAQAFFWNCIISFFLKFGMVLETHEIARDRAGFYEKKFFFAPKLRKKAQNGSKTGVFNLFKNLVINFYWIWSIMEIYIIWCVPAQIPYLGKFLFLRYRPKCSHPIRLQDFLINHISRTNQWYNLFFACWYNFA